MSNDLPKHKPYRPYGDPSKYTAEDLYTSPPLHERYIDPHTLNDALEILAQAEKKEAAKAPLKVSIKRADLDKFVEETGLRSWQAEEYFVLSEGSLEEALMIWVNQAPGEEAKKVSDMQGFVIRKSDIKDVREFEN